MKGLLGIVLLLTWGLATAQVCQLWCRLPEAAAGETIPTPLPGGKSATPLASILQQLASRMQRDGVTTANVASRHPETYSTPLVRVDAHGRVQTLILVHVLDPQVEPVLVAHQVQIERVEPTARMVQGWIPFDRLHTVAALPFVRHLRPPSYAHRR